MKQKQLCLAVALMATLLVVSTATVLAISNEAIPPPPEVAGEKPSSLDALQQRVTPSALRFVEATIGAPVSLDPHWQYDTASSEVIQQVYEPLIFLNREKIDEFVPMLAVDLPEISPDGMVYTFTIRQGVQFHEGGNLTPSDVAYSFWRWMIQDRGGGPGWIILDPMLGVYRIDDLPGTDADKCQAVKDAVTFDNNNWTVTFHLDRAFDPMMQILASPFASILDKEWMSANGGWGGDCSNWRDYHDPAIEESILWNQVNGTGPFMLDDWTSGQLTLARSDNYWRTEPMWEGGPSGLARLHEVVLVYEDDWPTRLEMLTSGEADCAYVPRQYGAEANQLVRDEYDGGEIDPGKLTVLNPDGNLRSFKNLPTMGSADAFFTFDINPDSPYTGTGELGSGIPITFFTDINVRKAFNHCFDWDTFIADVYGGEAEQRRGPIPRGVMGYDPAQEVYTYSLALCEDEFQQAWGGQVWSNGFSMTIAYNSGNEVRQRAAEIIKENVESINSGFHITVVDLPWTPQPGDPRPGYLNEIVARRLPVFVQGWHEDYHHPHNWVHTYMHSSGAWAQSQGLPQDLQDQFDPKIAGCLDSPDPETCYQELQAMAYENAIDIFLTQPLGRHYEQLWVNGYYHNPAYMGSYYFYAISKSIVETTSPDIFVEATAGQPGSLDPHWQYDTASAEVIQQVYEPLIFLKREKIDEFVPVLAVDLPEISPDGMVYTFTIRQGVQFHEGGDLTPSDVAYSFWRWMIQDRSGGSGWIILEPLTGWYAIEDIADYMGDDTAACNFIKSRVEYDNDNWTVTFHLNTAFDPILQILAGPWSSALDKEWMAANGGWGGDCSNWRDYHDPADYESILYDQMNGTGPFMFDSWTADQVGLLRNDTYWRTEPMWDGGPSGLARLGEIVLIYEPDWSTRLAMLASGEADSADMPTENIADANQLVRDEYDGGEMDPGKLTVLNPDGSLRSFKNLPTMRSADAFFTYDINPDSPYIGSAALDGNGIPTDFFTDSDVRKAFNHCFDWGTYIADAYGGEAEQRRGPIPRGVMGYDPAQEVYTHSLTACANEFQQAWGGQVWTNGFSMTIAYNEGNDQRQRALEIIEENVESINSSFHITVVDLPWSPQPGDPRPGYRDQIVASRLPIFVGGWGEDYHHPHNWVHPYMHSSGWYPEGQHFPQAMQDMFDLKIDECLELSGLAAETCYTDLQDMAHDYAIDIFLTQPLGRHYEQLWVNGYYHNPAYMGPYYFYAISKSVVETITTGGGGSLTYTDPGGLTTTLEIPAGAVTETVELRYTPLPEVPPLGSTGAFMGAGHYFELSAVISGTNQTVTSLAAPYTIIVTYSDEDLSPAIIEETLALYYWDGTQWVQEPTSVVDTVNNTITATPDHFSSWAALGETKQVFLPLVLRNY